MAAPIGNQYWKLAHDWKKPRKYEPDKLLDNAIEYAIWCEDNPLFELKVFGTGIKMEVPKMRAMTIQGFCLFANMTTKTFYEYEKEQAYCDIISRVRDLIYSQKFEGAAADLLNANIIARDLGLREHNELTGADGRDLIPARTLTKEEASALLKDLNNGKFPTV